MLIWKMSLRFSAIIALKLADLTGFQAANFPAALEGTIV
jgi:hypothetical protein